MLPTGLALLLLLGIALPADQPPAIQSLRAENVDTRRAAAIQIQDGDAATRKQALSSLIEILFKEKDGQVRLAALESITRLGPAAAPAIPALVHTLKTDYGGQGKEELHQDFRAALALAAIGGPAVEPLRRLLDQPKESVRAEVILALGRIGPAAGAAVPDLVARLDAPSPRLRREAATALGRIGSPAVSPLIQAATSPTMNVRAAAVEALGQCSSSTQELQQAVIRATRDPESTVRVAALRSLARLAAPMDEAEAAIKSGLSSSDRPVRLAAAEALLARPPLLQRLIPWLAEQLTSKNDGTARIAAHLLGEAGPDAVPGLLSATRESGIPVESMAQALAQHGRNAVPALITASRADHPVTRRVAVLAMGSVRPLPAEAIPMLSTALADPDPSVRTSALISLAGLGARARPVLASLRTLLKDESAVVRAGAVEVLASASPRDPALVVDLLPLLEDREPIVQKVAIATIRATGPSGRKALPAIIVKLASGPTDVRVAAAEFVGAQGAASAAAVPALTALLDAPETPLRIAAANALGQIGPPSQAAASKIASLLDLADVEARAVAISALANLELEPNAMRPYLSKSLRDPDARVWGVGLRSIQRLGPQGAPLIPEIIQLAARSPARTSAQRALRRFERQPPDGRLVADLIPLLDHESDEVQLLAIKFLALAGKGAAPAIPALERLREHKSKEVREKAGAASRQILDK